MKNKLIRSDRRADVSKMQPVILFGIIVLMILVQNILVPGSMSVPQLFIISRQASALGIVALGQAMVILMGGTDLSVGSMVMITNVFCIAAMQGSDEHLAYGIVVCVLFGLLVGIVNAVGVLVLRIAPFVMTLCTMTILQGISYVYTQGAPTGSAAPAIRTLGTGKVFGLIPYSTIIWLVLALVLWLVVRYTAFGRKLYAVGGNRKAARHSGVNSNLMVAFSYIFSSLMATLAGIILSGYMNITSLTLGGDYVMNSLAAVLIGGNAIEGGRGGVWPVVLGAFFIQLLMAMLTMLGITEVGKLIAQGVIIFTVVAIQGVMQKKK